MLGREWTGVTVVEAKLKKVLLKAEAAGTRYIPTYLHIFMIDTDSRTL